MAKASWTGKGKLLLSHEEMKYLSSLLYNRTDFEEEPLAQGIYDALGEIGVNPWEMEIPEWKKAEDDES